MLLALQDEKLDTIYLLTDGYPGRGEIDDPKRIVKSIAQLNSMRRVQINCISIGKESSLLKQLAAESGGLYGAILKRPYEAGHSTYALRTHCVRLRMDALF